MIGEIRDKETAQIAFRASVTGHLVLSTVHTNDAAGAVTRLVEMEVQPFLISSSVLGVIAQRLVRRLCRQCRQPYKPSAQDIRSLGVDANRMHALSGAGVQSFRGVKVGDARERQEAEDLTAELADLEMREHGTPLPSLDAESTRAAQLGKIGGEAPIPTELKSTVFYRPTGCEACAQTGYRGRIAISEMLILDEPVRREILNNSDAATIQKVATGRGMRTLREDGARIVIDGVTSLEEVLAATQAGEVDG
jgi:general secretion pathway protein E